jgi:lipoprotein-releasing system permease protein
MPYEVFIGLRYLKARRKQIGISLTTLISIVGVTVGVAALIATLAVMTGFKEELRDKILGTNSHIVIDSHAHAELDDFETQVESIATIPEVVAVTPFIFRQVLLSSDAGVFGVVLRGIDPVREAQVTQIEKNLVSGKLNNLSHPEQFRPEESHGRQSHPPVPPAQRLPTTEGITHSPAPSAETAATDPVLPGIIIGVELAARLEAFLGDTLHVISPVGNENITSMSLTPKIRKFRVIGIFDSGMYEYDTALAYISIPEAQKFFRLPGQVSGIEVRVTTIDIASDVARAIEAKLGFPYRARDWFAMNRNLFYALKLEKMVMFIILTLIILVASFNIVSTLTMTVLEKGREIAILKAMGARRKSIMRIFMLEGVLIGTIGVVLGLPLGLAICSFLFHFYTLPTDVYYLSHLPIKILPLDILLVSVSAILIGFLATLYPSWQAAKLDPAEGLRYE